MATMISGVNGKQQVRISVMTFNMGNAPLAVDGLAPLFNGEPDADIYVFGLQESTYSVTKKDADSGDLEDRQLQRKLSGASLTLEDKENENSSTTSATSLSETKKEASMTGMIKKIEITDSVQETENEIRRKLGDHLFYKVGGKQRAQMQILVFARHFLRSSIPKDKFFTNAENTGFAHVFPNKGGICVSMMVDGTRLAFITCHLAAHEGVEKCMTRNASIEEILGGVRFNEDYGGKYDVSMTHHHTFLMGDLNYRITFDPRTPADVDPAKKTAKKDNKAIKRTSSPPIKTDDLSSNASPNPLSSLPSTRLSNISNSSGQGEKERERGMSRGVSTFGGLKDKDDEDEDDLSGNMSNERINLLNQAFYWVDNKQWDELLGYDELFRELEGGRVLEGFHTSKPTFPPTFKRIRKVSLASDMATVHAHDVQLAFKADSHEDLTKTEKEEEILPITTVSEASKFYNHARMPSYTDRVLYKSLPGFQDHFQVIGLYSYEDIKTSDHKPVRALFSIVTTPDYFTGSIRSNPQSRPIQISPPPPQPSPGLPHTIDSPKRNSMDMQQSLSSPRSTRLMIDRVSKKNATRNSFVMKPLRPVITIGKFKGKGMAVMDMTVFGGTSDPYVTVTMDPPQLVDMTASDTRLRTKTVYKELNPSWGEERIVINLLDADSEELKACHVRVSVWDEDTITEDDLIGSCLIPVKDLLPEVEIEKFAYGQSDICGKPKDVTDVRLLENGLWKGSLSFTIQLKFEVDKGLGNINSKTKVGCHCSIS